MFLRFVPDALDAFVTTSSRLTSLELVRVQGDLMDSDVFLAMSSLAFFLAIGYIARHPVGLRGYDIFRGCHVGGFGRRSFVRYFEMGL